MSKLLNQGFVLLYNIIISGYFPFWSEEAKIDILPRIVRRATKKTGTEMNFIF